jgi:hypothetical protein
MVYLVALMIAFLFILASPQAAFADTGWTADAHKYELSAIYTEPVNSSSDRQKNVVKDISVYSALPLIGRNSQSNESAIGSITKVDDRSIVSGYKDRPGWRL